jgi:hypothetical protein
MSAADAVGGSEKGKEGLRKLLESPLEFALFATSIVTLWPVALVLAAIALSEKPR